MEEESYPRPELCVSLCEATPPDATADDLEALMAGACADAGFPYCERIYVGSYFCDDYFCALGSGLPGGTLHGSGPSSNNLHGSGFHDAMRELCLRHGLRATLVVPIFGQTLLEEGERAIAETMERFGDVYDEIVANDVASFLNLDARFGKRMGIGRLFSKEPRDVRIETMMERHATPELSAEAMECAAAVKRNGTAPVVELDPVAAVVDASRILEEAPGATIAVHLPLCYATTGRNCTVASTDLPIEEKFRPGRRCALECLDTRQRWRTGEGASYLKHGRTFFFENPSCAIAGTPAWRIIYCNM